MSASGRYKMQGLARAWVLAVVFTFLRTSVVTAGPGDELTPWSHKEWSDGASVKYALDISVPSWLKDRVRAIMEGTYADPETNNSNGPRYDEDTPAAVTVLEVKGVDAPAICPTGWLGCATSNAPNRIWIRQDPSTGYGKKDWCHVNLVAGCIDVGRVVIHEVGHMSGYLDHYGVDDAYGRTRMTELPPKKSEAPSNYDATVLGRCDEARMQREYGVRLTWGGFRKCWDEVANTNPDGSLKTKVTASPHASSTCSGDPIVLSGRLSIEVHGSYGEVSDSNLGLRLVDIYRNSQPYSSDQTGSNEAGNNWSKAFSFTVSTTTSYTFQARFISSENAVGNDNSGTHTLTWVNDPLVCG